MHLRQMRPAGAAGLLLVAGIFAGSDAAPRPADEATDAPPTAAPAPLPVPTGAAPLAAENAERDALLREMLRKELPAASDDERQIWLETLRTVPLESVPQLLQLRRELGSVSRPAPEPLRPDKLVPPPHDVEPLPESLPHEGGPLESIPPTEAALINARQVIRNNIANALTPGFKRVRFVLSALPHKSSSESASAGTSPDIGEANQPDALSIGQGMWLASTEPDLSPGPPQRTGRTLDVMIDGDGFFPLRSKGERLYTRAGHFTRDPSGALVLVRIGGVYTLDADIAIPDDALAVRIHPDGTVTATVAGEDQPRRLGEIALVRFANPEALAPRGDCLLAATDAAGSPRTGRPGSAGLGPLRSGTLEGSNVDLDRELVEWEQVSKLLRIVRELDVVE